MSKVCVDKFCVEQVVCGQVTNCGQLTSLDLVRLSTEKQEGKKKYKSDGGVMVGEFVCVYVCACTGE